MSLSRVAGKRSEIAAPNIIGDDVTCDNKRNSVTCDTVVRDHFRKYQNVYIVLVAASPLAIALSGLENINIKGKSLVSVMRGFSSGLSNFPQCCQYIFFRRRSNLCPISKALHPALHVHFVE